MKKFEYYYGKYEHGGIYLGAYEDDELYADVSVCLEAYGISTGDNQIIINTEYISDEDYIQCKQDLAKDVLRIVRFGSYNTVGYLVNLRDDWRDYCKSFE